MPKKSPTLCNAIGCNRLTHNGYCEEHKRDVDNTYAQTRNDVREQSFYKTPQWKKLRAYKRNIDPLCEECLLSGLATPMAIADHIIEIKDDWSKRLEISNLRSLCYKCHNKKTNEEAKKRRNNKLNNNINNSINTNWFMKD